MSEVKSYVVHGEEYKCFLAGMFKGKNVIIVPSFAEHREGTDPRDFSLNLAWKINMARFHVMVVGEELETMDFGEVGKLKR